MALSRHPFFPKFFLSVADWAVRLWNEDVRTPIMATPYAPTYLMGGCWSPSRPGVLYTISHGGVLTAWDYYYKHKQPVLSVKVSEHPLTALAIQGGGGAAQRLAGVACHDGAVSLLQLSQGLVEVQDNEKALISGVSTGLPLEVTSLHCGAHAGWVLMCWRQLVQMLERETNREKNLEKIAKEAKARSRKEEAARKEEPLDADVDEELAKVGGGVPRNLVVDASMCACLFPSSIFLPPCRLRRSLRSWQAAPRMLIAQYHGWRTTNTYFDAQCCCAPALGLVARCLAASLSHDATVLFT